MNALGAPEWNPEELGSKKGEREKIQIYQLYCGFHYDKNSASVDGG